MFLGDRSEHSAVAKVRFERVTIEHILSNHENSRKNVKMFCCNTIEVRRLRSDQEA
jgi:hypothetical protein